LPPDGGVSLESAIAVTPFYGVVRPGAGASIFPLGRSCERHFYRTSAILWQRRSAQLRFWCLNGIVALMAITPAQCRAARALLEWTQDDLAARSRVSKRTILHFEKSSGRKTIPANMDALQRAFEAAGVVFIDNGEGPGVRLRRDVAD